MYAFWCDGCNNYVSGNPTDSFKGQDGYRFAYCQKCVKTNKKYAKIAKRLKTKS